MEVAAGTRLGLFLSSGRADLDVAGIDVETDALSFGPYFKTRLSDTYEVTGYALFARPDYEVGGTSYEAERRAAGLTANANYMWGNTEIESFLGVSGFSEDHPSAGALSSRTVSALTGSIGTKAIFGQGAPLRPYVSIGADFNRYDDGVNRRTTHNTPRLGTGFTYHTGSGSLSMDLNGGQIAPPVMGATAFIIAEFLQISYAEVVVAALLPAAFYYLLLYRQVDSYAAANGLHGEPRESLPRLGAALKGSTPLIVPLGVLMYFLFWLGYAPGKSALYASGAALVLYVLSGWRVRKGLRQMPEILVQAGETLVPILLVCAIAGIIIGTINVTGLGFALTLALGKIAELGGSLPLLVVTPCGRARPLLVTPCGRAMPLLWHIAMALQRLCYGSAMALP